MIISIWLTASALYLAFLYWYINWSGPIAAEEIDSYIEKFSKGSGAAHTDADVVRRFMEEDDGKEFVMQNFVTLHSGKMSHPVTGEQVNPQDVLAGYFKPFAKELFKRGGHPVFMTRKVGGYIDSWNCDKDPQWAATAMMRYKCRRDLIELASDQRFSDIHIFKTSAIDKTVSFPVQITMSFFLRPRFYVPVGLVWLASMAHFIALIV
ncbi:hypothetical protein N9A71_01820 [Porticoccaceae bacterium]|nr:hypothetical protein [Porticoccaceae bacterium]